MTDENKEDLPKPILIEDLGMMFHTEGGVNKRKGLVYIDVDFVGQNLKLIHIIS